VVVGPFGPATRRREFLSDPGAPLVREHADRSDLARHFAAFARSAEHDGSPVYEQICRGAATDPELLALTELAPPDQRRPNILLAAVHFLLLDGAEHPLAAHYDTVLDWRRVSGAPPPAKAGGGVFSNFADFCRHYRAEVAELVATRATQTNEVGRCAALRPAFATVAAEHRQPLGLIDLGASAGLNLLFDHYAYDYGGLRRIGPPDSPVVLACELREDTVPPLGFPEVVHRAGIDRHPVDPHNEDGSLWLLACQWPGHLGRFHRMRDALAIARNVSDRPPVETGDIIEDLARIAAFVPDSAHLCVYHSWVAAYLSPGRQYELGQAITALAADRAVSWVFAESPYETPGLPSPPAPKTIKGATALVLVDLDAGSRRERRLADMHPHGVWMHWWGGG